LEPRRKAKPNPCLGVNHPMFGDLARFDAVKMTVRSAKFLDEDESIMIHLTVTGRCYARCQGCINSAITMGILEPRSSLITFQESEPERDSVIILELVKRHPDKIITVCFYGGEPFLAVDKMEKVWRNLKESKAGKMIRYMVYTNGELLIEAMNRYPEFMRDMWLYSISIDGDKKQHNRIRKGTNLNKIKRNLKELRDKFKGHIMQWSTLREEQSLYTCFEEFLRLYKQRLVDHFFWHWAETKEPYEDFAAYVRKYSQELEKLMDVYVKKIGEGESLPICHINELILYLLTGKERGHTACGVELAKNYDIVSGKVYPCADLPSCLNIGELDSDGKLSLKESNLNSLVEYKSWLGCYECGVHAYCGGRCPVQALAGSRERTLQYCQLMRLHVGIVQERIDEIMAALDREGITPKEIYESSAVLTKYTDVVP